MFTCNLSEKEGFTSQEKPAFFFEDSFCCMWWELAGMGCKGTVFLLMAVSTWCDCGSCISKVRLVNKNYGQILLLSSPLFNLCYLLVMPKSRGAHLLSAGLAVPNSPSLLERKESGSWGWRIPSSFPGCYLTATPYAAVLTQ